MCCHDRKSQIILRHEQVVNKKESIEGISLFQEEKTSRSMVAIFTYLKDCPVQDL